MEDEKVKQFFTELKELCLKHQIETIGYLDYKTGKAIGVEKGGKSYFFSGSYNRTDNSYWMAYEPEDKAIEV